MSIFEIRDSQLYKVSKDLSEVHLLSAEDSYEIVKRGLIEGLRVQDEFEDINLVIIETKDGLAIQAHLSNRSGSFVIKSLRECPTYIVDKGTWIPISPGSLEEAIELLLEINISEIGKVTIHQAMYLYIHGRRIRPAIRHEWDYSKFTAPSTLTPQPVMTVTPYEYQKIGFEWLSWLKMAGVGGLLGDEMGLGKTLQIIMLLQQELSVGNGPNLVVCPPSLLGNWRREIDRFIGVDAYVHQGSNRKFDRKYFQQQRIVVISYDAVRRDYLYLKQVNWNVIAVDEAQYIKNSESLRTISLMQLPKRMGVAVTGTPIENSLDDLWSLMNFSCEGLLGTKE